MIFKFVNYCTLKNKIDSKEKGYVVAMSLMRLQTAQ